MNEYDPFDEQKFEKTENDATESWDDALNTAPEELSDPAGAEARIDPSSDYDPHSCDASAEADAPISPAADPFGSAAGETRQDYQNYYYASGPSSTARPAAGAYTGRRNEPSDSYTVQAQTKQEKRRSGFWKKAVALALVCALLGGGAGFGGALLANKLQPAKTNAVNGPGSGSVVQVAAPRESTELNVITVDSGKLKTAAQVYETNVNSTVGITTEITTTNIWGFQSTSAAAGSGFILTEDGYILTNQHVIDKANTITVAMYDGTKYPATLIGYDTSNDIAVLKIDAKGLTPVTLGSSDSLKVGDEVIAIGNPLGELTFSLTKGNVSALNRAVTLSKNVTMHLIQTDAAINSGNSGGALFNMYGEVVGITNAKYSSSGYSGQASIDNIGFAIPINSIREIVSSIIEKGYISRPYIGVGVDNVSEESQSYGMPKGAAIRSVEADSPAAKGGLQVNDIVTAINGETITDYEGLKAKISASQPGDVLELTVYRKGETLSVTVTVGEKRQEAIPQDAQQGQGQQGQNEQGQGQQGQGEQGEDPFGWGFGGFPWGFGG